MTTHEAEAAFKYAAGELTEFIENNPTSGDDAMVHKAIGSSIEHEDIQPIVMEALEMKNLSSGISHIIKHSKNLPNAIVALHLFSSMSLAAKVADDPFVLIAILSMGETKDE